MPAYRITKDGQELICFSAEGLQFGRRVKSGSLQETLMVDDSHTLKLLDSDNQPIFVMYLTKKENVKIEKCSE